MKKRVGLLIVLMSLLLVMSGCTKESEKDYFCKNQPLSDACFKKGEGPTYNGSIFYGEESVFFENFSDDVVNAQPFSWLLYRSDTYPIGAVEAKVLYDEVKGKYLSLYSDGNNSPLYNPNRSLIFTRQFNLDEKGYGYAEADMLIPSIKNNEIYFEVTTGAVNVISININKNGNVRVVSGGVYHNYQGTIENVNTNVTLSYDIWYRFRLEWNRDKDFVKAFIYDKETDKRLILYEGKFHISVRENVSNKGKPVVPNVVRFSMPYLANRDGYAYVSNIRVDSQIESED